MAKVLIADNHPIIHQSLFELLGSEFGQIDSITAESSGEVFDQIKGNAFFELIMVGENLSGIETGLLIAEIHRLAPNSNILLFADHFSYEKAIWYVVNGASGYITKSSKLSDVKSALQAQLSNRPFFSMEMLMAIAQEKIINLKIGKSPRVVTAGGVMQPAFLKLSKKELEVLNYLIAGKSTTDIARTLNLKPSTISTHKLAIFKKMGVTNVVSLISLLLER